MTPELRDANARRAALEQYAKAHARLDERERFLRSLGMHENATVTHGAALVALQGWRAEEEDPPPKETTHA